MSGFLQACLARGESTYNCAKAYERARCGEGRGAPEKCILDCIDSGNSAYHCGDACKATGCVGYSDKSHTSKVDGVKTFWVMHASGGLTITPPAARRDSTEFGGIANIGVGPYFRFGSSRNDFFDSSLVGLMVRGNFGSEMNLRGALSFLKFIHYFGVGIQLSGGGDIDNSQPFIGANIFGTLDEVGFLSGLTLITEVDHMFKADDNAARDVVSVMLGWSIPL